MWVLGWTTIQLIVAVVVAETEQFFQQGSAQSWTKLFPKMNWDPGRFLQLISYSNYPILHMCAPVPSIKQISEHLARTSRPPNASAASSMSSSIKHEQSTALATDAAPALHP